MDSILSLYQASKTNERLKYFRGIGAATLSSKLVSQCSNLGTGSIIY